MRGGMPGGGEKEKARECDARGLDPSLELLDPDRRLLQPRLIVKIGGGTVGPFALWALAGHDAQRLQSDEFVNLNEGCAVAVLRSLQRHDEKRHVVVPCPSGNEGIRALVVVTRDQDHIGMRTMLTVERGLELGSIRPVRCAGDDDFRTLRRECVQFPGFDGREIMPQLNAGGGIGKARDVGGA